MTCHDCQSVLPDLLLDQTATSADARAHVQSCTACQQELASLKATFALLDSWEAPEPSAYFDQKLAVLLREEQAMAPAGWFERLRSRLLFNTGRQFRPALAGAMALVLIIGGGTLANLSVHDSVEASPTVQDLQILDKNAQALQTMDQLLQEEDLPAEDGSSNSPTSI
jgi:hypothetical protein